MARFEVSGGQGVLPIWHLEIAVFLGSPLGEVKACPVFLTAGDKPLSNELNGFLGIRGNSIRWQDGLAPGKGNHG